MPRVTASERDATRRRLVEAAKSEFADRGLAGARFDEISLAAGHAKGTIYNYFPSKEALFFAIVEEWCAMLTDARPDAHLPALDQLAEIARLDVEIARKDPTLARVIIQQMPGLSGTSRVAANEAIAPGIDVLTSVIAAGQQTREVDPTVPAVTLARLFLTVLSAIELEALEQDTSLRLDDVVELMRRHFINGLAPQ